MPAFRFLFPNSISLVASALAAFASLTAIPAATFGEDAVYSDVEFAAFDGSTQRYVEILPPNFDPARPTTLLIVLHGHGSDRLQVPSDAYPEFRALRAVAAERGAVIISPDYRAKTSWMGPAAERDVVQIIDETKKRLNVDAVVVSGASMGGSSSLTFAALRPELVDGVISINGTANHLEYENFQDAISESFGGSKTAVPLEYKNRSAEYFPERFVGFPTAFTLGGQDTVVPPDSARRLAETIQKIGGDVLVLFRPEGGHSTTYEDTVEAANFVFDRLKK